MKNQPIHDNIPKYLSVGFRGLRGMPNRWDEGGIKASDRTDAAADDAYGDFDGFRVVRNKK